MKSNVAVWYVWNESGVCGYIAIVWRVLGHRHLKIARLRAGIWKSSSDPTMQRVIGAENLSSPLTSELLCALAVWFGYRIRMWRSAFREVEKRTHLQIPKSTSSIPTNETLSMQKNLVPPRPSPYLLLHWPLKMTIEYRRGGRLFLRLKTDASADW